MLFVYFFMLGLLVHSTVAPSDGPRTKLDSPPNWHPGNLKAPDDQKFLYTDDDKVVENIIASGYKPSVEETVVADVENNTPIRITIQDHYNTYVCVQRVRVYVHVADEAGWILRDNLLANCEGGSQFIQYSRLHFGFTNAIHFFGVNRIIFKIYWGKENWKCHERTYTKAGRRDRDLTQEQCNTKLSEIYTNQGYIHNLLRTIFHCSP